jgi:acetyl-CoA carboxylase biotin carboxyl carrier protein
MSKAASAKMQQENDENNNVADKHKEEKSGSPSLNMDELRELAELIDEYGLVDFEFENANIRVHMRKQGAPVHYAPASPVAMTVPMAAQAADNSAPNSSGAAGAETEAAAEEWSGSVITSPIVGTYYQSPSPDAPAFVKVGDKVKRGQVVCIIEAMKLMNEIESEYDGEIVKIYVENGQAVEFGQPLFAVK